MFRAGTARITSKPLTNLLSPSVRLTSKTGLQRAQLTTFARSIPSSRPTCLALAQRKPLPLALQRFASTDQEKVFHAKIQPHPEEVSTSSSVRPIFGEMKAEDGEKEVDTMASIKDDLNTIKDTFALAEVPRDALYLGLAGVLPYLATSMSTLYLAWDMTHAAESGVGYFFSPQTAELLLHMLEPIQIGYGAVILSFLGAIHWGLEWAKFGGVQSYRRYATGVLASAVAWPTILMPVEYALITQFFAFSFLYYSDARASVHGLAPPWYSMYRFVLTFIVGASITVSLIGRGQIADRITHHPNIAERIKAVRNNQPREVGDDEGEQRQNKTAEEEEEIGDNEKGKKIPDKE
ncbi:MAG: hypothetical protein M1834_002938 [Cirrosporium novae-zelandiae]|nr:MAG: hypothetical protein M1834_002938 [Cirrosporium novae-zelandiae]